MLNFIKKYCYISVPIITIILILAFLYLNTYLNINVSFADDLSSSIVQISGTLIGFLLTAITIFLSLPKDTTIMQRVKKYNHHIIFSRCIFCGLTLLIASIFMWIFKISDIYVLLMFALGLEETIMSAYYIYKLCIYNFK